MATTLPSDAYLSTLTAAVAPSPAPTRAGDATGTTNRHVSLFVILGIGIVCAFDAGIVAALLTPIKASLSLNDEAFGRIAATFTVAGMAGAPVFGYLAGRFGRKPVLVGAVLLWSLASAGNALAGSVAGLMLWRGLTGFGEAAYQGLAPSWISDLYDRRWRNFVFSLYMVRNKVGTALSLAIGAWLAAAYDWRVAFLVSGIPGVLLALVLLRLREPEPGASDGAVEARRSLSLSDQLGVLRIPAYVLHLAALMFFFTGTTTAQMWAPAYLHRVFAISNQEASSFLAAVLLFTTPVGLIGGFALGRTLVRHAWGLTSALALTSLLAAGFFAAAFATRDLGMAKLFIVLAICAFGSTAGSLTTLMVESAPPHLRVAAGSIGAFVSASVAGAAGPWVLGALSDRYGLDRAIYLGAVAYALAGLIWVLGAVRLARTPSNQGYSA